MSMRETQSASHAPAGPRPAKAPHHSPTPSELMLAFHCSRQQQQQQQQQQLETEEAGTAVAPRPPLEVATREADNAINRRHNQQLSYPSQQKDENAKPLHRHHPFEQQQQQRVFAPPPLFSADPAPLFSHSCAAHADPNANEGREEGAPTVLFPRGLTAATTSAVLLPLGHATIAATSSLKEGPLFVETRHGDLTTAAEAEDGGAPPAPLVTYADMCDAAFPAARRFLSLNSASTLGEVAAHEAFAAAAIAAAVNANANANTDSTRTGTATTGARTASAAHISSSHRQQQRQKQQKEPDAFAPAPFAPSTSSYITLLARAEHAATGRELFVDPSITSTSTTTTSLHTTASANAGTFDPLLAPSMERIGRIVSGRAEGSRSAPSALGPTAATAYDVFGTWHQYLQALASVGLTREMSEKDGPRLVESMLAVVGGLSETFGLAVSVLGSVGSLDTQMEIHKQMQQQQQQHQYASNAGNYASWMLLASALRCELLAPIGGVVNAIISPILFAASSSQQQKSVIDKKAVDTLRECVEHLVVRSRADAVRCFAIAAAAAAAHSSVGSSGGTAHSLSPLVSMLSNGTLSETLLAKAVAPADRRAADFARENKRVVVEWLASFPSSSSPANASWVSSCPLAAAPFPLTSASSVSAVAIPFLLTSTESDRLIRIALELGLTISYAAAARLPQLSAPSAAQQLWAGNFYGVNYLRAGLRVGLSSPWSANIVAATIRGGGGGGVGGGLHRARWNRRQQKRPLFSEEEEEERNRNEAAAFSDNAVADVSDANAMTDSFYSNARIARGRQPLLITFSSQFQSSASASSCSSSSVLSEEAEAMAAAKVPLFETLSAALASERRLLRVAEQRQQWIGNSFCCDDSLEKETDGSAKQKGPANATDVDSTAIRPLLLSLALSNGQSYGEMLAREAVSSTATAATISGGGREAPPLSTRYGLVAGPPSPPGDSDPAALCQCRGTSRTNEEEEIVGILSAAYYPSPAGPVRLQRGNGCGPYGFVSVCAVCGRQQLPAAPQRLPITAAITNSEAKSAANARLARLLPINVTSSEAKAALGDLPAIAGLLIARERSEASMLGASSSSSAPLLDSSPSPSSSASASLGVIGYVSPLDIACRVLHTDGGRDDEGSHNNSTTNNSGAERPFPGSSGAAATSLFTSFYARRFVAGAAANVTMANYLYACVNTDAFAVGCGDLEANFAPPLAPCPFLIPPASAAAKRLRKVLQGSQNEEQYQRLHQSEPVMAVTPSEVSMRYSDPLSAMLLSMPPRLAPFSDADRVHHHHSASPHSLAARAEALLNAAFPGRGLTCPAEGEDISAAPVARPLRSDPAAAFIAAPHSDLRPHMRVVLVDWLVEVAVKYKLLDETLMLAAAIVDAYLAAAFAAAYGAHSIVLAETRAAIFADLEMREGVEANERAGRQGGHTNSTGSYPKKSHADNAVLHRYQQSLAAYAHGGSDGGSESSSSFSSGLGGASFSRHSLQLLGSAALMIAAKVDEVYPPCSADFVHITDSAFTLPQLLAMERAVLARLGYRVCFPSVLMFAQTILSSAAAAVPLPPPLPPSSDASTAVDPMEQGCAVASAIGYQIGPSAFDAAALNTMVTAERDDAAAAATAAISSDSNTNRFKTAAVVERRLALGCPSTAEEGDDADGGVSSDNTASITTRSPLAPAEDTQAFSDDDDDDDAVAGGGAARTEVPCLSENRGGGGVEVVTNEIATHTTMSTLTSSSTTVAAAAAALTVPATSLAYPLELRTRSLLRDSSTLRAIGTSSSSAATNDAEEDGVSASSLLVNGGASAMGALSVSEVARRALNASFNTIADARRRRREVACDGSSLLPLQPLLAHPSKTANEKEENSHHGNEAAVGAFSSASVACDPLTMTPTQQQRTLLIRGQWQQRRAAGAGASFAAARRSSSGRGRAAAHRREAGCYLNWRAGGVFFGFSVAGCSTPRRLRYRRSPSAASNASFSTIAVRRRQQRQKLASASLSLPRPASYPLRITMSRRRSKRGGKANRSRCSPGAASSAPGAFFLSPVAALSADGATPRQQQQQQQQRHQQDSNPDARAAALSPFPDATGASPTGFPFSFSPTITGPHCSTPPQQAETVCSSLSHDRSGAPPSSLTAQFAGCRSAHDAVAIASAALSSSTDGHCNTSNSGELARLMRRYYSGPQHHHHASTSASHSVAVPTEAEVEAAVADYVLSSQLAAGTHIEASIVSYICHLLTVRCCYGELALPSTAAAAAVGIARLWAGEVLFSANSEADATFGRLVAEAEAAAADEDGVAAGEDDGAKEGSSRRRAAAADAIAAAATTRRAEATAMQMAILFPTAAVRDAAAHIVAIIAAERCATRALVAAACEALADAADADMRWLRGHCAATVGRPAQQRAAGALQTALISHSSAASQTAINGNATSNKVRAAAAAALRLLNATCGNCATTAATTIAASRQHAGNSSGSSSDDDASSVASPSTCSPSASLAHAVANGEGGKGTAEEEQEELWWGPAVSSSAAAASAAAAESEAFDFYAHFNAESLSQQQKAHLRHRLTAPCSDAVMHHVTDAIAAAQDRAAEEAALARQQQQRLRQHQQYLQRLGQKAEEAEEARAEAEEAGDFEAAAEAEATARALAVTAEAAAAELARQQLISASAAPPPKTGIFMKFISRRFDSVSLLPVPSIVASLAQAM